MSKATLRISQFIPGIALCLISFFPQLVSASQASHSLRFSARQDSTVLTRYDSLFNKLKLGKLGLGRRAFDYAIVGYNVLKAKNKLTNLNILSIADMTTASGRKRFFVIDMKNSKLLFVTYVAHGRNSGLDKTLHFSNESESNKSSVGFYITSITYAGNHGYSMRLEGQEIGYNSNALKRDIVVHSADYVSEAVVQSQGYIGRSLGCPALSPAVYRPIIDKIKNGSCLFIFGNDTKYIVNSQLLKRPLKMDKNKKTKSALLPGSGTTPMPAVNR